MNAGQRKDKVHSMQKQQTGDIFTWIRHPVPRILALSFIAGGTLGLVSLYATAELGRILVLLLGFPCLLALANATIMQKLRKNRFTGFVSMALAQAVISATLQFSGIAQHMHIPGGPEASTQQSATTPDTLAD
jgi:predicted neutral ceramidase superfamily lipid hydrolase